MIAIVTSPISDLSKVIDLETFIKYKNLVLGISGLTANSYITTNDILII